MHTATRRVASVVAVIPMALLASACSSGGGSDTTKITEGADYSDGTLSGDHAGEGLEQLGDWQDLIPSEEDDGDETLPDEDALDDWESGTGFVGSWFSTDSYSTYLSVYDDGSSYIISESDTCYGSYTDTGGGAATLSFPGCANPAYESGTATLAGEAMEIVWSDGSSESYSQNAADQAPPDGDGGGGGGGGGSSENVGEEISGIWAGDDGSFFMVIPADESGTGIANASYLAAGSSTECIGILLEDILGEGWDATVSCDEEMSGDYLFADVTLDGEALTVSWPDTGESAEYQWFSEWDA